MAKRISIRDAAQAVVDAGYVVANWEDHEGDFADFLAALAVLEDTLDHDRNRATVNVTTEKDDRCTYTFPLPDWMGPDQDDPCRCDLGAGHSIPHSCSHLRGEKTEAI